MQGLLFRYGPAAPQVAFRTGGAPRHLVLVGGLTDGLLFAPFAQQLADAAGRAGYSLVQAQLLSSYQGWGVGSLDQDADDLLLLSRHLRAEMGSEALVIMGHSTGTQDAVRFCQRHGGAEGAAPLAGVILQAPVSDREWLSHFYPDVLALLPKAEAMVAAGQGDEIICRAPDDLGAAPLCARRLAALAARLGDDDMWSGDIKDSELQHLLGHMGRWPLLLLQSGADECVVDTRTIPELGRRVMGAVAGPDGRRDGDGASRDEERRSVVIEGAPHNAAGFEAELARHVQEFLSALPV